MNICDYGCGQDGLFYKKYKNKWCCSKSTSTCPAMKSRNSDLKKGINPWENKPHPKGFTGKKPPHTGKTLEEFYGKETADRMKHAISEHMKTVDMKARFDNFSPKVKEAFRQRMKQNRIGGYIKGSGRGKSGWYKGFWCDSSWELAFVMYHLDHDIPIKRNEERFEYTFGDKTFKYIPDFLIHNQLYEIKGYMTEQTKSKMEQCPKSIQLLDKYSIKPYLEYARCKYGKDYIRLYEPRKD